MDKELELTREWFLENPKGRLMEKFARKNLPTLYERVSTFPGNRFSERLYNYFKNQNFIPKCTCGKDLKFISFGEGYQKNCSQKCNTSNPLRSLKAKITTFERYGVDNISKLEEIKKKKEETSIEHYGVAHFNNRDKAKSTMLERYGVENIFLRDDIKQKARNRFYKTFLDNNPLIVSINENIYTCTCPHENCNKCTSREFNITNIAYNNRKYSNSELCTVLSPEDSNVFSNTSLEIFVKNILDEYNITYIENDRSILGTKELDIYIPSKSIAIECNGCYWHSHIFKDKKYHYDKYRLCRDKNIQLISVWEDWIQQYPNKVRSIILSKLGIYEERVGARKCDIREINSNDSNCFLDMYHLQNHVSSSYNLGLYYRDELVSVMTFGKRKLLDKKVDWELLRYCCRNGVQIIGGAERLLKYFINSKKPNSITSFSSNDISSGDLYNKLGFDVVSQTLSYWYIDKNMNRSHRYKFRKSELVKLGYDSSKTEFQITEDMKLLRIYDTGQQKWIKTLF